VHLFGDAMVGDGIEISSEEKDACIADVMIGADLP